MTTNKAAALAMLDELRGMFATGVLADARRLGAGVLAELERAFAIDRIVPEAALGGRPVVRDTGELATLCERARARFAIDPPAAVGLVRQLLQLAADLGGGPRAPHELRDDAGRTIAFAEPIDRSTSRGFPMLELPVPVLHPSAWPVAAARVGVTVDELRERDLAPLAPQLDDLLVRSIPRIRPDAMPQRYFLPRDQFAGTTVVEDPLVEAYERLRALVTRRAHYIDSQAPAQLVDDATRSFQGAVDDIAAAAATAFEPHDAWVSDGPTFDEHHPYRGPADTSAYDGHPRLVWLDDDRIAVTRGGAVAIISLADGRVLHTIPLGWGDRPTACDDTGRYLLVAGQFMSMLACIDTDTGRWLDAVPDELSAVAYHKNDVDGYEDSEDELFVFELRREKLATFAGEWATPLAWARGNLAVLIGDNFDRIGAHGIRSTRSMLELVSYATLAARAVDAPVLCADGTLGAADVDLDAAMRARWTGRWGEPWPCAIAEVDGRWRMLLPTLHVGDVEHTWFRLGFPIDAASWSPDGRRLAVLGDELRIIDIATRTIIHRLPA